MIYCLQFYIERTVNEMTMYVLNTKNAKPGNQNTGCRAFVRVVHGP